MNDRLFLHAKSIWGLKFNEAALFEGFSEDGSFFTFRTRGVYRMLRPHKGLNPPAVC
jgi:hypothetical protein